MKIVWLIILIVIVVIGISSGKNTSSKVTPTHQPTIDPNWSALSMEKNKKAWAEKNSVAINEAAEDMVDDYLFYLGQAEWNKAQSIKKLAEETSWYYSGNKYRNGLLEDIMAEEKGRC